MLQRQLKVLKYPKADEFRLEDPQQFRHVVNWLEASKLRTSKGFTLKDTYAANWNDLYIQYLKDIDCPMEWYSAEGTSFSNNTLTWLVGKAIKLQYSTKAAELNEKSSALMMISDGSCPNKKMKTSSNPIENLDFQSTDFREGVRRLADLLKVSQSHPDHLVTLEACCKVIQNRLSQKGMKNVKILASKKGESFNLKDHDFGVPKDITDPVLKEAVKILRLIHLHNLRELQSDINAAIETVQAATANPKTDTRLGKVGR